MATEAPLTIQLVLSIPVNTTASRPARTSVLCPKDADFDYVILQFPTGPQFNAIVWVDIDGHKVWPPQVQGGHPGIALDGISPRFPVKIPVLRNQTLGFSGTNSDLTNTHEVVMIIGEDRGP